MRDKNQLFCFTCAGGTAAFFDTIEADIPEIELVKLEYAGHGVRHKEPMYRDFAALADDLYDILVKTRSTESYALFGYSMGAISLVEVLRRIIKRGEITLPESVFLAALEPRTKECRKSFRVIEASGGCIFLCTGRITPLLGNTDLKNWI